GSYDLAPADLFDFLHGLDYRVVGIDGRWLDREAFTHSATLQALWDYVAVPAEDEPAQRAVTRTLEDTAGRWLPFWAALAAARQEAAAVGAMPSRQHFSPWLRPLARRVTAWVL